MFRTETVDQMLGLLTTFQGFYRGGDSVAEAQKRATRQIAQRYQVREQTIMDLQNRRLGLTMNQWRHLLELWIAGNMEPLRETLLKAVPHNYRGTFTESLGKPSPATAPPLPATTRQEPTTPVTFRLEHKAARMLAVLAIMRDQPESEWLKDKVTPIIAAEYDTWLRSQTK